MKRSRLAEHFGQWSSLKGVYLCGGRGEAGRWGEAFLGEGEAAHAGEWPELRLGLREVSGELGNSSRKDGGGRTGVEMC